MYRPAIKKARVGLALTIAAAVALTFWGARLRHAVSPIQAATVPSYKIRSVSPMNHGRAFTTATTLGTGIVLVTGGIDPQHNYLPTAELFDPRSQKFMVLGQMTTARASHSATLLANGQVLIAGGVDCAAGECSYLASAEIFDPGTRRFSPIAGMTVARANHTATLLNDGTVLIAGGVAKDDPMAGAEIYNPVSGRFTSVGPMGSARFLHTATLLGNGQVLIAGGRGCADECDDNWASGTAELYDPTTRKFSPTVGPMTQTRILQTATLASDGRVLIAGGRACIADCEGDKTLQNTEIYDPTSKTFSPGANMNAARAAHTAIAMPNGQIFIYGGSNCTRRSGCQYLASAEVYAPDTGTFIPAGSGSVAGANCVAALVSSQQILIAGGRNRGNILNAAELFSFSGS
jgi:Galactose oxidase, central domain